MADPRAIVWAPGAVSDARQALADADAVSADGARALCERIAAEVRGLLKRGRVFDVPPELMEIGLTGIRETRAGDLRIFFRATRSRISIIGVLDARHDPGEALFRRTVRSGM